MDGENLELADASFAAVLCRFGLIYMPHQQRALAEWRRLLKPFSLGGEPRCAAAPVRV
jgi:ubiquinone/menaquinone biosynthesis C-methylase UbiE